MNSRKAVTLRFKDKDLKIIHQIIRKEFGPIPVDMGIKSILLNIMQAYINQLAKAVEASKEVPSNPEVTINEEVITCGEVDTTGDSSEVYVPCASSPILSE